MRPLLSGALLHVLGLDHTRLTVRFDGRDLRLTGAFGLVERARLAEQVPATERLSGRHDAILRPGPRF